MPQGYLVDEEEQAFKKYQEIKQTAQEGFDLREDIEKLKNQLLSSYTVGQRAAIEPFLENPASFKSWDELLLAAKNEPTLSHSSSLSRMLFGTVFFLGGVSALALTQSGFFELSLNTLKAINTFGAIGVLSGVLQGGLGIQAYRSETRRFHEAYSQHLELWEDSPKEEETEVPEPVLHSAPVFQQEVNTVQDLMATKSQVFYS